MQNNKKIFLGGTCNESIWRDILIPKLKIDYFNPVVDDWNAEAQKRELHERETCDWVLYWLTPKMTGVYAIAEVVDDSNKRPTKAIFGYFIRDGDKVFSEGQIRSLQAVGAMIESNGAYWCRSLEEVAQLVNYERPQ